jgi:hypothetical protein
MATTLPSTPTLLLAINVYQPINAPASTTVQPFFGVKEFKEI